MEPRAIWKPFLYAMIVSIALTAMAGVATLLSGHFGEIEAKIMGSTFTLTLFCFGAMICMTRLSMVDAIGLRRAAPICGLTLCSISTLVILVEIWQLDLFGFHWRLTLTLITWSTATVHICLLGLARLKSSMVTFYWITCGLILLLAAFITVQIADNRSIQFTWHFLSALSVLVTACTLVIPILHWLSRDSFAETRSGSDSLTQLDLEIEQLQEKIRQLEARRSELLRNFAEGIAQTT